MTRFNGDAPLTVVLMCSVGLPASANVKVAVSVWPVADGAKRHL